MPHVSRTPAAVCSGASTRKAEQFKMKLLSGKELEPQVQGARLSLSLWGAPRKAGPSAGRTPRPQWAVTVALCCPHL